MKRLFIVIHSDKALFSHRLPVALAAKENGYDVTIVTSFTGLENKIRELGFSVIEMPINVTGMNLKEELQTLCFLTKLYKIEKPDIIHHVSIKVVLWGTIAANLTGRKKVVNAISGTGFIFAPEKRDSLFCKAIRFVLRMNSRSYYKYIFQNKDDEKLFIDAKILKSKQVEFIKGSGVDLTKYEYVPESKKENKKLKIVFTGRMVEPKGILVLLEAASLLKAEYENKIQFLLCGEFYENPTSLKKEEFDTMCDGSYIKYLGFQSDIYSILKKCHIMAFPSYYMEGLPKSVIDAEAAGLPVITTDWVGCRDSIADGYNGFLIPIKDSKSLADKIKILIEDSDLRQKMGINSRKYAEENFDIEIVKKRHIEIYNSLS